MAATSLHLPVNAQLPTKNVLTLDAAKKVAAAAEAEAKKRGAIVSYNDPYFPYVGRGRHYDLDMTNTPLENLGQFDAVLIVTDHTSYDYRAIVDQSQLVIDTRNATKGIASPKIVRC